MNVRDVEKWSVLWAAAVAVSEMCIRRGKFGTARDLGKLYENPRQRDESLQPLQSVAVDLRLL